MRERLAVWLHDVSCANNMRKTLQDCRAPYRRHKASLFIFDGALSTCQTSDEAAVHVETAVRCAGNQNCGPRRQLHWKIKKKRSAGTTNPRLHSSGILLDETVNRPSLLRERTGDIRVLMQICSECHISTLSCITLERVHRTSTCNAWATHDQEAVYSTGHEACAELLESAAELYEFNLGS